MTLTVTTRGATNTVAATPEHPSASREAAAAIVIPVSLVPVPLRKGDLVTALPWGWS